MYGIPFSPDNDGENAKATWNRITTPKLTFALSNLQQSAPSNSATGSSTAPSGRVSDAVSDSGARRTLLSWGMAVTGLALGAIGLTL